MADKLVVRCTVYLDGGNPESEDTGWATEDNPIWFYNVRVLEPDDPDFEDYPLMDEKYLCGGTAPAEEHRDMSLLKTDTLKIIPLDELPDHVCVALAKRALTEGDDA